MADTVTTLVIKDGDKATSGLSAISSSTGYSTYHALTGTLASDLSSSLSSIRTNINNLLTGTTISASVDIITGDTNIITGALDNVSSSINAVSSSLNAISSSFGSKLSDLSSSLSTISSNIVKFATGSIITPITYTTMIAGTKSTVTSKSNRSNVTIFNHTNGDMYLAISSSVDTSNYSYVIASSGSYYSEKCDARLEHSLTGSSAMTTGRVLITETLF